MSTGSTFTITRSHQHIVARPSGIMMGTARMLSGGIRTRLWNRSRMPSLRGSGRLRREHDAPRIAVAQARSRIGAVSAARSEVSSPWSPVARVIFWRRPPAPTSVEGAASRPAPLTAVGCCGGTIGRQVAWHPPDDRSRAPLGHADGSPGLSDPHPSRAPVQLVGPADATAATRSHHGATRTGTSRISVPWPRVSGRTPQRDRPDRVRAGSGAPDASRVSRWENAGGSALGPATHRSPRRRARRPRWTTNAAVANSITPPRTQIRQSVPTP